LTFLATTGKPQPPMEAKKTMTVDMSDSEARPSTRSLTNCSHVQWEIVLGAIRLAPAHWLLRHGEEYKIRRKVSREEYAGSLPKLARSYVAGDDGRTKRM
jgi:hypothetical protein